MDQSLGHPDAPGTRRTILGAAVLLLIVSLAYAPAVRNEFIWDDDQYVTRNPVLLSVEGLREIWFSSRATPQYYPLVHTGFWIEKRLWDLDPRGYHAVNVGLHAASTVVLWRTLALLGLPGAWVAAALFGVHPFQVESVAWVTERKNVLSLLFFLLAAHAWLGAVGIGEPVPGRPEEPRPKRRRLAAAYLFLVAALLSKTVTAMLPVALALVVWWLRGRLSRREAISLAPMVALGAAGGLFTAWLERTRVGAVGVDWALSPIERVLVAGRALWFYLGQLLWPARLTFIYPRWSVDARDWPQYLFPAAFLGLVLLCVAMRARWGRGPAAALGIHAVLLFPALGFLNVYPMRYSFVADHFQYHASLVPISFAVAAIASGAGGAARRSEDAGAGLDHTVRWLAVAIAAAGIATGGALTARQCAVYRNSETLWMDVVAKNPTAWIAYNNLGAIEMGRKHYPEAARCYRQAARLSPRATEALYNLGFLAVLRRDLAQAQAWQRALSEADPREGRDLQKMIDASATRFPAVAPPQARGAR